MTTWTEPMIKRAAGMWNKGDSAAQIACAMGLTRNAVIGITSRHRDLFPGRRNSVTVRVAKPKPVKVAKPKPVKSVVPAPAKIGRPPKPPAPPVEKSVFEDLLDGVANKRDLDRFRLPDQQPVAFADLASGQCKFILAAFDAVSGPDTLRCGAETPDLSPWCAKHRLVVFKARAA
ncbi:GcrA family cell cycle regulator [Rhizobium sp.]|jgi:hypothetical protein|uniref:GcrA family cell cycle regulator n=1 Tax=Rhizobium sp. TaxID=391 RepID=UPI000E998AC3|nr:hypothetical protein [Rhizobium sp.]